MGMENPMGCKAFMARDIIDQFAMIHDKKIEAFVAIGSFIVAATLAFIGQSMAEHGDIRGGTLMGCAQFLTLTATIFGIDYKLKRFDRQVNNEGRNKENAEGHS